jgi:hypothetical protein
MPATDLRVMGQIYDSSRKINISKLVVGLAFMFHIGKEWSLVMSTRLDSVDSEAPF